MGSRAQRSFIKSPSQEQRKPPSQTPPLSPGEKDNSYHLGTNSSCQGQAQQGLFTSFIVLTPQAAPRKENPRSFRGEGPGTRDTAKYLVKPRFPRTLILFSSQNSPPLETDLGGIPALPLTGLEPLGRSLQRLRGKSEPPAPSQPLSPSPPPSPQPASPASPLAPGGKEKEGGVSKKSHVLRIPTSCFTGALPPPREAKAGVRGCSGG